MTAHVDKDAVISRLTPDAVAAQYGVLGRWSGRWLRSKRCPASTHGTDAFGLSRDGKWHCHACDEGGGDLLSLVAAFEGLDCRNDFPAVLEVAAAIAGVDVEEDFEAAPRKPTHRPAPASTIAPLAQRVEVAVARAAWIWNLLDSNLERVRRAIGWRGIDLTPKTEREVRLLGFLRQPTMDPEMGRVVHRIFASSPGWGIAVRHIEMGALCDVRARRFEPAEGEPKILGMPGSVTVDSRRDGGADLVACYGRPHELGAATVVVAEGWADYLTAAWRWPAADVLGSVDAGQYPLVAGFAARYLAERGGGRLVLVVQDDTREPDFGEVAREGAAEKAVNLASKRAIALLGPEAVSWIECARWGVKDLNDIATAGRAGELQEVT